MLPKLLVPAGVKVFVMTIAGWKWALGVIGLAGLVLVLGAVALIAPKLIDSFKLRDAAHFSLTGSGGFLELISPLRLLDDLNLILFLVPLAPLALLLLVRRSDLDVIFNSIFWTQCQVLSSFVAWGRCVSCMCVNEWK